MFEMTENEFNECEQAERIKHDEKVKELEAQNKNLQEMLQATRETRVNADYLKKIAELEAQIEKMKQELDTAREEANRQEQWELYSVLNGIYNDNFEVTTSVSN